MKRMLVRNSIKMFGFKVIEVKPGYTQTNDEGVEVEFPAKRIPHLIKCVERIDDKERVDIRRICLTYQDGDEEYISDDIFYILWRAQGRKIKKGGLKLRYLNYDTFFDKNCRPEWCKEQLDKLLEPYHNDPAHPVNDKVNFWGRDFKLTIEDGKGPQCFSEVFALRQRVRVEDISKEDLI
jgi:hypothetical protein